MKNQTNSGAKKLSEMKGTLENFGKREDKVKENKWSGSRNLEKIPVEGEGEDF